MTAPRGLPPVLVFVAFGTLLLFTEIPPPDFGQTSGGLFLVARGVHNAVESLCLAAGDVAVSHDATDLLMLPALLLGIAALIATWSVVVQIVRVQGVRSVLQADEITCLPASLTRAAARVGLRGRVRLVESTDFSAFCLGLLSPDAWVSSSALEALDSTELEAVLRHEAWHVQQHDPIKVLIANAGSAAVGFLPFVSQKVRAYLLDKELQADAVVVQDMQDPYPLASALYRAASVDRHPLPATVGAFNSIDARIDQLLDAGEPRTERGSGLRASTLRLICSVAPTVTACVIVTSL